MTRIDSAHIIPRVETERLVLREWRDSDLETFARLNGDPEVTRYLGNGRTMGRWESWRGIAAAIGHWVLRGYGQWVIELKATGEPIGRTGLYYPDGWPGLEVGWVVAPEHWGNGYATEGARASLRYAWDVVGADDVISLIRPGNVRSVRVAEKLGGVRRQDVDVLGVEAMVFGYRR